MKIVEAIKSRSAFSRNVAVLVAGSGLAQIISLVITPLLTRLYTPDEFGVLALFLSICSILLVLVSGRYEMAIVQAETRIDALSLIFLSMLISFIFLSALGLCIYLFGEWNYIESLNEKLNGFLWVVPLFVFFMLLTNAISNYLNKMKEYGVISQSLVFQSASQSFSKVLLGFFGGVNNGLLLGALVGQVVIFVFVIIRFIKGNVNTKKMILACRAVKRSSVKYVSFPKYMLLSDGINVVSIQLPVLLTGYLFSQGELGLLSLAIGMSSIPLRLIGGSLSRVFRQEASEKYNNDGECREVFDVTLKKMSLFLILPFVGVFVLSPTMFSLVFCAEWKGSGELLQVMLPMFFFQFMARVLNCMYLISGHQKNMLYVQVVLLVFSVLSFYIGFAFFDDIKVALILFSVTYSLVYIFTIRQSLLYSRSI